MARAEVIGGIDIGSHKICTLLAEATPEGHLRILGVGVEPARGIRKGLIDNIQQATEAISASVEKAERASGNRMPPAVVNVSGQHLSSLNHKGVATLTGGQHLIQPQDVQRAMEDARSVSIPSDRELLHVIPRGFLLDGQNPVSDPVGMYGQRLDVEAHLVTANATAVQNLARCLDKAGVRVVALVAAPLASAEAVLEDEEKRQGVVVVDIGGGTTDVAVFLDGSPYYTASLPVGGYNFTHDLVYGLRVPFSVAEELKVSHGAALVSRVNQDDAVEVESFGGHRRKLIPRKEIVRILQARAEEVLEMVYSEVKRAQFDVMLAAGLVLTGGVASLPGLDELAEQLLGIPVRVGFPKGVHGMADVVGTPAFATGVGLLRWGLTLEGLRYRPIRQGSSIWGRITNWLKLLIPQ